MLLLWSAVAVATTQAERLAQVEAVAEIVSDDSRSCEVRFRDWQAMADDSGVRFEEPTGAVDEELRVLVKAMMPVFAFLDECREDVYLQHIARRKSNDSADTLYEVAQGGHRASRVRLSWKLQHDVLTTASGAQQWLLLPPIEGKGHRFQELEPEEFSEPPLDPDQILARKKHHAGSRRGTLGFRRDEKRKLLRHLGESCSDDGCGEEVRFHDLYCSGIGATGGCRVDYSVDSADGRLRRACWMFPRRDSSGEYFPKYLETPEFPFGGYFEVTPAVVEGLVVCESMAERLF